VDSPTVLQQIHTYIHAPMACRVLLRPADCNALDHPLCERPVTTHSCVREPLRAAVDNLYMHLAVPQVTGTTYSTEGTVFEATGQNILRQPSTQPCLWAAAMTRYSCVDLGRHGSSTHSLKSRCSWGRSSWAQRRLDSALPGSWLHHLWGVEDDRGLRGVVD